MLSSPAPARTIPQYAAVMDSLLAAPNPRLLLPLHGRLLHLGLSSHRFLRPKLLAAYLAAGHHNHFHLLLSISLSSSHPSPPLPLPVLHRLGFRIPPRAFAAAFRSAASLPAATTALHAAALRRNAILAPSLVAAYSACGDIAAARQVFDELPGTSRSLASVTALISALGAHGLSGEAVELFEKEVGMGMDDAAVTSVLAACARAGMVEEGRRIFARVERPVLLHYTCMVDLLGRAGEVEEAEELVARMEGEPDRVLWATLLAACRMHGRVDVAERVARRVYGGVVGERRQVVGAGFGAS